MFREGFLKEVMSKQRLERQVVGRGRWEEYLERGNSMGEGPEVREQSSCLEHETCEQSWTVKCDSYSPQWFLTCEMWRIPTEMCCKGKTHQIPNTYHAKNMKANYL